MIWWLIVSFIALVFGLPAAAWFVEWAYEYGGEYWGIGAVGLVVFIIIAVWAISIELFNTYW